MHRLVRLTPVLVAALLALGCGSAPHWEPTPPGTPRPSPEATGSGVTAGWTVGAKSVPDGIEVTVQAAGPLDVPSCRPLVTWLEDASGRTVVPIAVQNWMCAREPDVIIAPGATAPFSDTMRVRSALPAGSYTIHGRLRTASGDVEIPVTPYAVP